MCSGYFARGCPPSGGIDRARYEAPGGRSSVAPPRALMRPDSRPLFSSLRDVRYAKLMAILLIYCSEN